MLFFMKDYFNDMVLLAKLLGLMICVDLANPVTDWRHSYVVICALHTLFLRYTGHTSTSRYS